jgi:OmpA-OmpF porin, OOP family
MASKKYIFLVGLISLFCSVAFAQSNDASYDWKDSSKVPTKLLPQHNEFVNNNYPYPAKPRDQWEVSFHGGGAAIIGDVSPRLGFGGGIGLRKALGHTFSVRLDYTGNLNKGLDYRLRTGGTGAWAAYNTAARPYVANYKTQSHQANLDLIASLNNKSYYRGNPKNDIYVFGGYTFLVADVDVDAANGATPYNFATIMAGKFSRKDIRSALKSALDGSYETNATATNGNRNPIGRVKDNQLLRHAASVGAGFSHKFNDKIHLGLEQRFTLTFDDDIDGLNVGRSNDVISYTALRLGVNVGNKAKKVQPLYWINPNNYVYNELNKSTHAILPKKKLDDADGDGITDQFDLEPNTPAGAPVDSHGRSLDTDGDGVIDLKDKEPLTQKSCFPVNADGVGSCPEPACCKELRDAVKDIKDNMVKKPTGGDCAIGDLPTVQFKANSAKLSKDAEAILGSVAQKAQANADCKIKVIGHGASDKRSQQLSWDRVNAVIKYLVEKQGLSEGRFIFSYGEGGDVNTVDLTGTTEEGPSTVPAPHPNLKKG